jgi:phi13 family phage major tail protein
MGRIVHGNRNFGYAPINVDEQGNYSFGEVTMLSGMVSSSMEVEQEDTSIYADDKTYCMIKGAKARSIEVNLRYIPSDYAQYLGFKLNENGMLTDTGNFPNHCLFFESEEEDCDTGESTVTLHYLYNVKGGEPSKETATDEEEVEAQEITINYNAMDSAFVVDDDGEFVQYGYITRTDENATTYDTFKQAVLLPTTEISM